jgi:hypothetical protein
MSAELTRREALLGRAAGVVLTLFIIYCITGWVLVSLPPKMDKVPRPIPLEPIARVLTSDAVFVE